jgi:hypothetical protein
VSNTSGYLKRKSYIVRVEKDFEEFIELLAANKVKYVIVGAFAVAFHSRARNTGDIDFFVDHEPKNAKALLHALDDFGFESLDITEADLVKPDVVLQLGFEPNRIDIMTSISGVAFSQAFKNKIAGKFGKHRAYFISRNDLIKNKIAAGRLKDRADVEQLQRVDNKKLRGS